jgi:hypothetical protein
MEDDFDTEYANFLATAKKLHESLGAVIKYETKKRPLRIEERLFASIMSRMVTTQERDCPVTLWGDELKTVINWVNERVARDGALEAAHAALNWIEDNLGAHPANIRRVIHDYISKHAEPPMILALRKAFPQFADKAPITPEAIEKLGEEWHEMVLHWEPSPTEIKFYDQDGIDRLIVRDSSDDGLCETWGIPVEAHWIVIQKSRA